MSDHADGERDVLVSGEYQKVEIGNGTFYIGDCFDVMRDLPDGSVDMVLCDLPYGTTQNKWDSVLPLDQVWREYRRVTRSKGAVILTGAQPFTSALITSNLPWFKQALVWKKNVASNFLNAGRQHLMRHEDVIVFGQGQPIFNKQMAVGTPYTARRNGKDDTGDNYGSISSRTDTINLGSRNPISILEFDREVGLHPTQKPVALFEYLIRTYTDDDMVVLDNTAGSGTTAIAAENAGRRWICIERDPEYAAKAIERIRAHVQQQKNVIPFRQPAREVVPLHIPVESPLWWAVAV